MSRWEMDSCLRQRPLRAATTGYPHGRVMVAALALLNLIVPDWLLRGEGGFIFFSLWGGGALLSYYVWFVWLPRKLSSSGSIPSISPVTR